MEYALNEEAVKEKKPKKIIYNISCHTFAKVAVENIHIRALKSYTGIPKINITIGYQSNFIHNQADDALYKVLNGA